MTITIVIADDHPVVRTGIRGMLEGQEDFEIVAEARNGREAVEAAATHQPDIVLMDLRMPEMDGVEATEAIRAAHPDVNVLVLTTYDTDADILRAIEAGATGYLLKDSPRDDLYRGIRGAARGESVLAPVVASRLMGQMRSPGEESLSPREIEVLQLVGRGATNQAIAKQLHISKATVKTHLVHIFDKLHVNDRTAAVTTALERGIIRLDDISST